MPSQYTDYLSRVYHVFWENAQVPRNQIIRQKDDALATDPAANLSWSGFIGERYLVKRVLFIAHFPAGGTSSYEHSTYARKDMGFYEAIREFKLSLPTRRAYCFQRLNEVGRQYIPEWSIYRVMEQFFRASDLSLDDVSFINAIPYRIFENRKPGSEEVAAAWVHCTERSIAILDPKIIICLGQATGDILNKHYRGFKPVHVLKRRIGDKSIDSSVGPECVRIVQRLEMSSPPGKEWDR